MDAVFKRLLEFLDGLEAAHIAYDLKHVRDSLMVVVRVPGGYCEIEFFVGGEVEIEWFRSAGGVQEVDPNWLNDFLDQERD
jgi:hypothetical protein